MLNPATPLSAIEHVLGDLDLVLVMSVNPGFGGQAFIESQLAKIAALRKAIDTLGKPIDLEVDGGVNVETAKRCIKAGADVLVPAPPCSPAGRNATRPTSRRCAHERHDPAPLSEFALLREGAHRLRREAGRLEVGRDPEHDAEARPDAADRRLSQDSGDAGRRRHLLRHAAHHAGDREARARAAAAAQGQGRRCAGAGDVDRPQHLLGGGRRRHGGAGRQAAGSLSQGPQRVLGPLVRPCRAQGRGADGAAADLRAARHCGSRCWPTAGPICWATRPVWPIARSTIPSGSSRSGWGAERRCRRSTGCR